MEKPQNLTANRLRSHGSLLTHPFFLMAPYKAGSTMLFLYTKSICRLLNVSYVDYPQHIWEKGGDLKGEYYANPLADEMLSEPLVYVGNRQAIQTLSPFVQTKMNCTLMIRDPKDCLVSMYYSFLQSHAVPTAHKTDSAGVTISELNATKPHLLPDINDYVLQNAEWYKQLINEMFEFGKEAHNFSVIRYEDFIYEKAKLCNYLYAQLRQLYINNHTSDLTLRVKKAFSCIPTILHPLAIRIIAKKEDKIPLKENTRVHVRKAVPGDHLDKLKSDTIQRLDKIYSDILGGWYCF